MKSVRSRKGSGNISPRIPDDRSFQILKLLLGDLRAVLDSLTSKYKLTDEQILQLVRADEAPENGIPASILTNTELRPLEILCKYLKEERNLGYKEISGLLNRDYRTIWTTYRNASRKLKAGLAVPPTKYVLPASIFQDRKLSVLEAAVAHLKEKGLKLVEISSLLNRDQRNIWSIYNKATKKWKNR
ncbi:hypothetical protein HYX10_04050 [Candidatus Woesearchaeota archaeon]|nr:hypothetical protein [Candidatus Woesearchaeota archaeon]